VKVTSENFEFFVICTPGFEAVSVSELKQWYPQLDCKGERGGLTVFAPLATGFEFNRVLKTPTRVLLRLVNFGCRDFPKLFKKIAGFPWEEWLDDRCRVNFFAASSGSRLKIKTRLEETCWEARVARLKKRGRPHSRFEGPPADVYVRLTNDVCLLSLDTSGEILHKRGVRLLTTDAPVRETLAAAILTWMLDLARCEGLKREGIELVDAMCGSGTFLIEASGLSQEIKSRRFAFEDFKVHLPTAAIQHEEMPRSFSSLIGFDRDARAFKAAELNLRGIAGAQLRHADFFTVEALAEHSNRWIVANPPYDERLSIQGGARALYEKLLMEAERVARPQLAGFLFPESANPESLRMPRGWRRLAVQKFLNGGIAVSAVVYLRRPKVSES
jgi:putative N6-adenine-specific DNA methylase